MGSAVTWQAMMMLECDLCGRCQLFTGSDPEAAYTEAAAEGWAIDDVADVPAGDLCPPCAQLV